MVYCPLNILGGEIGTEKDSEEIFIISETQDSVRHITDQVYEMIFVHSTSFKFTLKKFGLQSINFW